MSKPFNESCDELREAVDNLKKELIATKEFKWLVAHPRQVLIGLIVLLAAVFLYELITYGEIRVYPPKSWGIDR